MSNNKSLADELANRCEDAYSVDRYKSWSKVAEALLDYGLTERQVEAVMRSKWTRWAADAHGGAYGTIPAKAIISYIKSSETQDSIEALTFDHFDRYER
jgi:hypothetical protein